MAVKDNLLKALEKELHENHALINSTPDMIWVVDSEMRLVAFNESYKQAVEVTQQREVKRYDSVLVKSFGAELNNKWKGYYKRALSGESFKVLEQAKIAGKTIHGEVVFHPIIKNGQTIGVSCFNRDITTLKESQQQLNESEERLRLAIEAGNIGTFDFYPLENIVLWNDRLYEIFDLNPGTEVDLNQHFLNHLHPEDAERVKRDFDQSLAPDGSEKMAHEYRIIVGKKVKHILAHSYIFRNEQGQVVRMLGTTQDITTLRIYEQKLKRSEELLHSVVQDQDEMIVRWKPGGIRTFANKSYLKFYNLKEDEAIGTSFYDLISPKEKKRIIKEIEELSPEKPTRDNVHSVLLSDGSTGWQRWKDRAFFNEKGEPLEYQSVGQDITPLVDAQKLLEESEERYRDIFNQQFQFTTLLDLDGKVEIVNELPLQVQGVTREDYVDKYFWEAPVWGGNKAWQDKIRQQVIAASKTTEPLIVVDTFYGKDQEIRYANACYKLITNSDGKAANILVQAMDITGEKKANKEIQNHQQKLSLIYDNTTDFIILFRCEKHAYIIEELNKNCQDLIDLLGIHKRREDLLGYSLEDAFKELLHLTDQEIRDRLQVFDQIRKDKQLVSYERKMDTPKGLLVTKAEVIPVSKGSQTTHLLMVARDVTESYLDKKRIEANQRHLHEAYVELDKLKSKIELENIYLKEEIRQINDFEDMVFKSAEFRNVLNKVDQVAKTNATVLITGETGTGKELIARALHNTSNRSEKPLIKVNAAAIPKDLIESELFGYTKGAFTGAVKDKLGKFELADGGSIFLDEIGDMPPELQVKILRVLQEGEVERLGSTQVKKIDVRVIAATNKNLGNAVATGEFRADLFYRINVFPIEVPPLRSRPSDIPILVEHFIAKYNQKHSKNIRSIPRKAMDYLRNYAWPGNVRELENSIERGVILSMGETLSIPEVAPASATSEEWDHENALEVVQENHIRKILKACHWKIEGDDGAAAQLKIKPSTLRDKMKKFNIKRPKI